MSEQQATILHIDDNEANRYVVARVLQNAGFTVLAAATGIAGLEAIATHHPTLVILDVQLPDMTGFDVCRQIKGNPGTTSIPVLHLSASFIQSQDKAEGLDSGADGYLIQPVEPIELLATVRSLLRIRRAEESALSLAQEWQTTFDAINDSVCLIDKNGKFLRCNQATSRLFRQPVSSVVGCVYHEVLNVTFDVGDGTCFRAAKASHERQILELYANGRWFAKTIDPVLDSQGNFTGAVFIFSDITERKRIETERQQTEVVLQERNQRLDLLYSSTRALLSSSQPLTLISSLFEKLKDTLELDLYFNYLIDHERNQLHLASYQGISDTVAETIAWLDYGQFVCGTVAQRQHQIVCAAIQDSQDPKADLIRSLGLTAYSCQPLIAQGQLFGTLSFGSRRRTQFTAAETDLMQSLCDQMAIALDRSQLLISLQQQTDQLRQANRIKDEFLAVLSHELRSPLNPILGWSKILQKGKQDAAKTQYALETIERNAKLQAQLIEDLLDVSRILQGKLSLSTRLIQLPFTIEAALETVRLAAEAKSIQIQTVLDPSVGFVLGDANRLQQVFWNLIANAIKFTPPGGKVQVRLSSDPPVAVFESSNSLLSKPEVQEQSYAYITIADTGKGISPDFLPYVFDYFRQADSTTTRTFGGLGLGLAIVRHLVELHGGSVAAASPGEGQGATFTVKLPSATTPKSNLTDPFVHPDSNFNFNGLQVLFVDDDKDSREFVTFLLEQHGANVTEVESANEALNNLEQIEFDLLISDIGMPGTDGYALIRQIRARSLHQGREVPAIALTAYARDIDQQQALAAGFQHHLTKPVETETLMQAISTLVEGSERLMLPAKGIDSKGIDSKVLPGS